jgi:gamma-carbonic anhydrase
MLRVGARILVAIPTRARTSSSIASSGTGPLSTDVPAQPPPAVPNHRSVLALDGDAIRPFVQPNAFVAPSASVIGSVVVNDKAAVMYGAVVRGDLALIHIGAYSIIGDNATLAAGAIDGEMSPSDAIHTGLAVKADLTVGDYSNVGANSSLTSCTLDGRNIIGAGSTVNPGVKIGLGSVLEPNSMVPPDTEIPAAELWGGRPAHKIRSLSSDEISTFQRNAVDANATTTDHSFEFLPVGFGYLEREKTLKTNSTDFKAKE